MARKPSSNPTEVELQMLGVLWTKGPSTVREVHHALQDERDTGYSTTLKMMQVMTEKGLLLKDDSQRPQVYRPALSQDEAQTRFVDDIARALVQVQQLMPSGMQFVAAASGSSLLGRIRRIVDLSGQRTDASSRWIAGFGAQLVLLSQPQCRGTHPLDLVSPVDGGGLSASGVGCQIR